MHALVLVFQLTASYVDASGASHTLEVWRDRDHLRRDTDGKLSLFVTHARRGDDRYRIVDRARGRAYSVSHTNLYRLGNFADWDTLTTLLPPAARRARLQPTGEPDGSTPAGRCHWMGAGDHKVCVSSKWGLPLLLAEKHGAQWKTVLTVENVRQGSIPRTTFQPPPDVHEIDVDRDFGPQD